MKENDLSPFSPAGGGGLGAFASAAPMGMNPKMDRWMTPGHLSVRLPEVESQRRIENEQLLKNSNIKAFLDTLAKAEGADYDIKYGGTIGKRNDKWRIADYELPPSPGIDGKTTSSGRYQITKKTWCDFAVRAMDLHDFSPHTQDLIAIEILRSLTVTELLIDGDLQKAIFLASKRWEALPMGPGQPNRPIHGKPSHQPYMKYEDVVNTYIGFGGKMR